MVVACCLLVGICRCSLSVIHGLLFVVRRVLLFVAWLLLLVVYCYFLLCVVARGLLLVVVVALVLPLVVCLLFAVRNRLLVVCHSFVVVCWLLSFGVVCC